MKYRALIGVSLVMSCLGVVVIAALIGTEATRESRGQPAAAASALAVTPNEPTVTATLAMPRILATGGLADRLEEVIPQDTATRVVPLGIYTPVDTPTPTPTITDTPTPTPTSPTATPTPAATPTPIIKYIVKQPAGPGPAAAPAAPAPRAPAAPAAAPAPDHRCAERENATHQFMLSSIAAGYQGLLDTVRNQMNEATRQNDAVAYLRLQRELQQYQNEQASQVKTEAARHQMALGGCR